MRRQNLPVAMGSTERGDGKVNNSFWDFYKKGYRDGAVARKRCEVTVRFFFLKTVVILLHIYMLIEMRQ